VLWNTIVGIALMLTASFVIVRDRSKSKG